MTDQGLVNLRWAHALVDGLAAAGLRRAVVSPGSRSTPLVLACDRHPRIETRVLLDERSAAFLALGQAKTDGLPTAVIATSGSAPAHWYPALLEASLSHTPLLLLSADRPPEQQAWGANQTLDQQKLFGGHVRAFHQAGLPDDDPALLRQIRLFGVRAVEQSLGPDPGPVHLNLPFREPLVPAAPESHWPAEAGPAFSLLRSEAALPPAQVAAMSGRLQGHPGLIVCGPSCPGGDFAEAVTGLARFLDCPLLADPLSGLRFGPWDRSRLLSRYDSWLRRHDPAELPPAHWILRFGAPPVSKPLLQYLENSGATQILVTPYSDWPDPPHRSTALVRSDPARLCRALSSAVPPASSGASLSGWQRLETEAAPQPIADDGADRPFEGLLIPELLQTLPPDTILFSGNSQPIRQLDSWSGSAAKPLRILGNRGASGIDGNVATLAGIADAANGPVVGLLGDLTLAHDLGGLAAIGDRPMVLIVLNNGGGGIFGQLPQAGLAGFERYWLTPQGLDLEQAARLFGLSHTQVQRQSAFRPALTQAMSSSGPHLLEVIIDRHDSLRRHRTHWKT